MSVRKSCYTCKHYKRGLCSNGNIVICGDDLSGWELSDNAKVDMLHDAETVPVVTEKAEPRKCENCFWYCRTCHNKESAFYGNVIGKSGYCVHHDYKSEETNMNPEQPAHDAVNHPSHYTACGIECIDCIKAALGKNFMGFLIGNVIKYTYRYKDKNGVEELKEARRYIDLAIKELIGGKKNG